MHRANGFFAGLLEASTLDADLSLAAVDCAPQVAAARTEWGEAGGYAAEVHGDAGCVAALGIPYDQCRWRDVNTLSGGEQKRLVLESLLRGHDGVLLLDEPDNYLDVPGKRWLEQQLAASSSRSWLTSSTVFGVAASCCSSQRLPGTSR